MKGFGESCVDTWHQTGKCASALLMSECLKTGPEAARQHMTNLNKTQHVILDFAKKIKNTPTTCSICALTPSCKGDLERDKIDLAAAETNSYIGG